MLDFLLVLGLLINIDLQELCFRSALGTGSVPEVSATRFSAVAISLNLFTYLEGGGSESFRTLEQFQFSGAHAKLPTSSGNV